ncbi:MAG: hypothetical protein IH898_12435, partial [Planctomycetes bacterium]|nr:hypothetical protein [Planctomycetota bacterium]
MLSRHEQKALFTIHSGVPLSPLTALWIGIRFPAQIGYRAHRNSLQGCNMEQAATNSVFSRIRSFSTRQFGFFSGQIWCLLTLLPLFLYTFNLGGARALTQHEIFVAGPAKQMIQQREWLLPRIGDQFWLE